MHLFCGIFDVRVDWQRVCYVMDVLDGDLKAVEASGFRQRDLCGKVAAEIVIDDAIRCRKKKPRRGI